jgi:hypothetical protein
MSDRAKKIIIFVAITFLLIVTSSLWFATQQSGNKDVIKDKDTGETFDPKSREENTGGGGSLVSNVQLFGIEPAIKTLSTKDSLPGYTDAIKASIWQFSRDRLKDEFQTITLRPQNLKQDSDKITGEIRLGQTDTIIPIEITPTKTGRQAIVRINSNSSAYGGTFVYMGGVNNPDNLLFTIEQKNDSSDEIEVVSYGGYNEAALGYLESIGYRIPDLNISFKVESGL